MKFNKKNFKVGDAVSTRDGKIKGRIVMIHKDVCTIRSPFFNYFITQVILNDLILI